MKILTDELLELQVSTPGERNSLDRVIDDMVGPGDYRCERLCEVFAERYEWWLKNTPRGRRQAEIDAAYEQHNQIAAEVNIEKARKQI